LSADVDIETERHTNVISVPTQAVMGRAVEELPQRLKDRPEVDKNKQLATVVFLLKDGKAKITPVTIGASDMTHTEITSGIDRRRPPDHRPVQGAAEPEARSEGEGRQVREQHEADDDTIDDQPRRDQRRRLTSKPQPPITMSSLIRLRGITKHYTSAKSRSTRSAASIWTSGGTSTSPSWAPPGRASRP
jgi:hypothetical protein